MWKMLLGLVNPREMKAITAWFVFSAIMQGITLSLMIPFLRALYSRSDSLNTWLIPVVVLTVVTIVVDTYSAFRSYRVSVYEVCDTVISRVAEHALALPLGWFNAKRESAIVNATSKEINTLSHLVSLIIPSLCNAFIVPLVMIVATAFVSWPLALIMAAPIVPLYVMWRLMSRATTQANEMEDTAAAEASERLIEFAGLQPILRATGATKRGWEPLTESLDKDSEAVLRGLKVKSHPGLGFHLIVSLAFACVVALGMSFVLGQRLDFVAYLAVLAVTARMVLPLARAGLYSTEADNAAVALRSMTGILDASVLPEPAAGDEESNTGTSIEFDDVSFSYEDGRHVLNRIQLQAEQGQVTALVGPSGAGKSTILRLAARFWDATSGSVRIGGCDVRAMSSRHIMEITSMVFQDVYLFNTTIRENLRLARPQATDEELELAAERARLTSVIENLPDGWETQVGPGGLSLSGGERQRVAIARAFIKDSPILLLDEITSSLDGENESAIAEVIRELSDGRTVLVVAHRLSTIWNADKVVFLQPGEDGSVIAQSGLADELVGCPGPFRDFAEASQDSKRWHLVAN